MAQSAVNAHPAQGDFALEDDDLFDDYDDSEEESISPAPVAKSRRFKFFSAPADEKKYVGRVSDITRFRVTAGIMWVLLVIAAVGGTKALFFSPNAKAPVVQSQQADSTGPAGFAQLYLSTFLRSGAGDENALRAFYPGITTLSGVDSKRFVVMNTAILDKEQDPQNPNYWNFYAAAQLLSNERGADGNPTTVYQTRYYKFGVETVTAQLKDGRQFGSYIATSLPSQVAELPVTDPTSAPHLYAQSNSIPLTDDVKGSLTNFFKAYLAGTIDLNITISNDSKSRLRAITPSPYTDITIDEPTSIAQNADGSLSAFVTVRGTDASGRQGLLQYSVSLIQQDKVWRVTDVLPAAIIAAPAKQSNTNK